jgi:hypothetical protein
VKPDKAYFTGSPPEKIAGELQTIYSTKSRFSHTFQKLYKV